MIGKPLRIGLKRSTTPLKRSKLRRQGARGRARQKAWQEVKAQYLATWEHCQLCGLEFGDDAIPHHKIKRSLGGKDHGANLVIIHSYCHTQIHLDKLLYERVRDSEANALNGLLI